MKSVLLIIVLALMQVAESFAADQVARDFASVALGAVVLDRDPAVARADRVLTLLSHRCGESRERLGDMLVKAQYILRSKQIIQPLFPMAEGILYAAGARCAGGQAVEIITLYLIGREKGVSHEESIQGLRSLLGMGR